jgi:hypothetical protein
MPEGLSKIWDWIGTNQALLGLIFGIVTITGIILSIVWRKKDKIATKLMKEFIRNTMKEMLPQILQSDIINSINRLENPQTWEDWYAKGFATQIGGNAELALKYY